VSIRRLSTPHRLASLAVAVLGCQGSSREQAQVTPPPPPVVEVKDAQGGVIASIRAGRPCRATIGPIELIVGGPPLVAQLGSTRWSGSAGPNGTTLVRDDERVARVFPVGDPAQAAVLDMQGIALARIAVEGDTARVSEASGRPVRDLARKAGEITVSEPALSITGTDDLVLAALLTAPELTPEVRMLAACERLLVKDS
jgi:hypothetical protein